MPKATDLFKNKKDNGWGGDTLKSSLGRPFPVNSLATEGLLRAKSLRQNFHTEVGTKQTLI